MNSICQILAMSLLAGNVTQKEIQLAFLESCYRCNIASKIKVKCKVKITGVKMEFKEGSHSATMEATSSWLHLP